MSWALPQALGLLRGLCRPGHYCRQAIPWLFVGSAPRLGPPFVPCPDSWSGVSCRKITRCEALTPRGRNPGFSVFPGGGGTHPLGLEFKQSSLAPAWPNSRMPIDPMTLGLTSLPPHAVVPSFFRMKVNGSFYPPSSSGVGTSPTRPDNPSPRRTLQSNTPKYRACYWALRPMLPTRYSEAYRGRNSTGFDDEADA